MQSRPVLIARVPGSILAMCRRRDGTRKENKRRGDPETIDKTWRITTRAPEGPLQLADIARLNTVYRIAAASDEHGKANARYLKEQCIDNGKLGRASGEGFYKYESVPTRSPGSPVTASA
jgi:3-hydroxyacyl-CoA dehydrogenase